MTKRVVATILIIAFLAVVPPRVGAQQAVRLRAGISQPVAAGGHVLRNALHSQRRGNWEVGAVLGGVAGAAFGYALVVFHNDGLAEKWGVLPTAATIVGSAAIGAGFGVLVQALVSRL